MRVSERVLKESLQGGPVLIAGRQMDERTREDLGFQPGGTME